MCCGCIDAATHEYMLACGVVVVVVGDVSEPRTECFSSLIPLECGYAE